jgi:hypothetical protein
MSSPTPQPIKQEPDEQRVLWLAVRRGLLVIVKAIEQRYDVSSDERKKAA